MPKVFYLPDPDFLVCSTSDEVQKLEEAPDVSSLIVSGMVVVAASGWFFALLAILGKRHGKETWAAVRAYLRNPEPAPPVDQKVLQTFYDLRRDRFQRYAGPAGMLLFPFVIYGFMGPLLANDEELGANLLALGRYSLVWEGLGACMLGMLFVNFPHKDDQSMVEGVLDVIVIFFFLAVGFHSILVRSEFHYSNLGMVSGTVQVMLSLSAACPRRIGVVNVINVLFQVLVLGIRGLDFGTYLPIILFTALMVQVAAFVACEGLMSEAQLKVTLGEVVQRETAGRNLMNMMSDAVVRVHHSFSFRDLCPRFAAMLNLPPSALQHDNLLLYVTEADRRRVSEQFSDSPTAAGSLHTHLESELGIKVGVQIFYSAVQGDELGYIVALKEDGEANRGVEPGPEEDWHTILEQEAELMDAAREQETVVSSSEDSREERERELVASAMAGDLWCIFKPGLKVDYAVPSPECEHFFDFNEIGTGLLDKFRDEDGFIKDWLLSLYCREVRSGAPKKVHSSFGNIVISDIHGTKHKVHLSATFWDGRGPEDSPVTSGLQVKFTAPVTSSNEEGDRGNANENDLEEGGGTKMAL